MPRTSTAPPQIDHRAIARRAALIAVPVALLVGVLVFWQLGGFPSNPPDTPVLDASGAVAVAAPALTEPATSVCRALVTALPRSLRDRPRRAVSAGADQNAAYGAPPLTVACGVTPPSYAPTDLLPTVSGVCWSVKRGAAADDWYTADRTVALAVRVPHSYGPGGQWVVDLAPAISSTVPVAPTLPYGCRG